MLRRTQRPSAARRWQTQARRRSRCRPWTRTCRLCSLRTTTSSRSTTWGSIQTCRRSLRSRACRKARHRLHRLLRIRRRPPRPSRPCRQPANSRHRPSREPGLRRGSSALCRSKNSKLCCSSGSSSRCSSGRSNKPNSSCSSSRCSSSSHDSFSRVQSGPGWPPSCAPSSAQAVPRTRSCPLSSPRYASRWRPRSRLPQRRLPEL
mmetsp:Transcript_54930/g.158971  ORF Transcript_54930/g.158971 Transcript_54930/m.158971 type:complete len:205 (+) Transcript_54930:426-1040(+)